MLVSADKVQPRFGNDFAMDETTEKPEIIHLPAIAPVACPCGWARRAFESAASFPGTVHLTEITAEAHSHHHASHTEIYVILECEEGAEIELNGQRHPVHPLNAILIPPHTRHRAIGEMKVLIICTPEFDPKDEILG